MLTVDLFPDFLQQYVNHPDSIIVVCMGTNGFRVVFGYRVSVFYNYYNNRFGLGLASNGTYESYSFNPFCYEAYFRYDGEMTEPWTSLSIEWGGFTGAGTLGVDVDSYGQFWQCYNTSYPVYILNGHSSPTRLSGDGIPDTIPDSQSLYFDYSKYSLSSLFVGHLADGVTTYLYWIMGSSGSLQSIADLYANNTDNSMILKEVELQTLEQKQHETTKGILATLKDLPSMLWEKISDGLKGLFIPADVEIDGEKVSYFEAWSEEMKFFLQEHLGFIYEAPNTIIYFFECIADYEPAEVPTITFPAISIPILGKTYVLVDEDTEYRFDILSEEPFSQLYSVYKSFTWFVYLVLLINLAKRKFDKILWGGSA